MKRMTCEWIRKADGDFRVATILAARNEALHDSVCFHSQQAAEKCCKALLEELGQAIPKTHDLEDHLNLLLPHHASLGRYRRGLRRLTAFAVDPRYPLMHASKRQAQAALHWSERVGDECRKLVKLRPPRKRTSH